MSGQAYYKKQATEWVIRMKWHVRRDNVNQIIDLYDRAREDYGLDSRFVRGFTTWEGMTLWQSGYDRAMTDAAESIKKLLNQED